MTLRAPIHKVLAYREDEICRPSLSSGGCNLNRDIPKFIEENGFNFENAEIMYLPSIAHWVDFKY